MKSLEEMMDDISKSNKKRRQFIYECMSISTTFGDEYINHKLDQLKKDIKMWNKRRRIYSITQPKPTKAEAKALYKEELKKARYQIKGLKYLMS